MNAEITPKNAKKFKCEKCMFISSKLSDWNRHITTQKHLHTTDTTKYNISYAIVEKEYGCGCGKKYNHRSSLFNHKKKCKEPYLELDLDMKNIIIQDEQIINKHNNFFCETCKFSCNKKSNYELHLISIKHKKLTHSNNCNLKIEDTSFCCNNCKKIYKHASTLSAHKKKCNNSEVVTDPIVYDSDTEIKNLKNIILELIEKNKELEKQLIKF